MADPALEKVPKGDETGSTDEKAAATTVEDNKRLQRSEPPEFIRNLAPEERERLEKLLKRKLDYRILPAIIIMYIMNYIDRNNIAAARLAGLERDLHLSSTEFQTSVSILFVGYLLMQIPSNLFLNKFGKPAIYLPGCVRFSSLHFVPHNPSLLRYHLPLRMMCATTLTTVGGLDDGMGNDLSADSGLLERGWSAGEPVLPRHCRSRVFVSVHTCHVHVFGMFLAGRASTGSDPD
jgi:hypothetical protein